MMSGKNAAGSELQEEFAKEVERLSVQSGQKGRLGKQSAPFAERLRFRQRTACGVGELKMFFPLCRSGYRKRVFSSLLAVQYFRDNHSVDFSVNYTIFK